MVASDVHRKFRRAMSKCVHKMEKCVQTPNMIQTNVVVFLNFNFLYICFLLLDVSAERVENSIDTNATIPIVGITPSMSSNIAVSANNADNYMIDDIKLQLVAGTFDVRQVKTVAKNGVKRVNVSNVWDNYFQIYEKENNNDIKGWFRCIRCEALINNTYQKGTTTRFHRHDKVCPMNNVENQKNCAVSGVCKIAPKLIEQLKDAAAQFICKDLRPYYAIECAGLFELLYTAASIGKQCPNLTKADLKFALPSRMTVQRTIEAKVEEVKAMIQRKLLEAIEVSGGFSCTTDLWTDPYRQCP